MLILFVWLRFQVTGRRVNSRAQELDAALGTVMGKMKRIHEKRGVTVYYLLAERLASPGSSRRKVEKVENE